MIGSDAERAGILAGYERVVARLARAKVPKIAVVVRKAYGGGHFALGGRPTHPDLVLAWPTAEIGLHGARRRASARSTSAGSRRCSRTRARTPTTSSSPSCRRLGAGVGALGGGGAHLPRRRDRPSPHARGVAAGIDFAWGSGPRVSPRRYQGGSVPAGPLAHICLARRRTSTRRSRTGARSSAELDPAQLDEPVVLVDRWEAGEDVMSSATFVNPQGTEIQLLCPLNDGPLGRRLAKRGEHVHHICFTSPDLPDAVARLAENGHQADEHRLSRTIPRSLAALDVHLPRVEPRDARRARVPVPSGRRHVGAGRGRSGLS